MFREYEWFNDRFKYASPKTFDFLRPKSEDPFRLTQIPLLAWLHYLLSMSSQEGGSQAHAMAGLMGVVSVATDGSTARQKWKKIGLGKASKDNPWTAGAGRAPRMDRTGVMWSAGPGRLKAVLKGLQRMLNDRGTRAAFNDGEKLAVANAVHVIMEEHKDFDADPEIPAICVQVLAACEHRDFHSLLQCVKMVRLVRDAGGHHPGIREAGLQALTTVGVVDPTGKMERHIRTKLEQHGESAETWHDACHDFLSDCMDKFKQHVRTMDKAPTGDDADGHVHALNHWVATHVEEEPPAPPPPPEPEEVVNSPTERTAEPHERSRSSVYRIGYTGRDADSGRAGMSGADRLQTAGSDRAGGQRGSGRGDPYGALASEDSAGWGAQEGSGGGGVWVSNVGGTGFGDDPYGDVDPMWYGRRVWRGGSLHFGGYQTSQHRVGLPKLKRGRLRMHIKPSEPAVAPYAETQPSLSDPAHAHRVPVAPLKPSGARGRRPHHLPQGVAAAAAAADEGLTPGGRPVSPEYPAAWMHTQEKLDPDTNPFNLLGPGKFFKASKTVTTPPPPSPPRQEVKLPPLSWAIQ